MVAGLSADSRLEPMLTICLCVWTRTGVFAAVLLSAAATLASQWAMTAWSLVHLTCQTLLLCYWPSRRHQPPPPARPRPPSPRRRPQPRRAVQPHPWTILVQCLLRRSCLVTRRTWTLATRLKVALVGRRAEGAGGHPGSIPLAAAARARLVHTFLDACDPNADLCNNCY